MSFTRILLTAGVLLTALATSRSASAAQPMVELRAGSQVFTGRIVERGRGWCWLYDREGRLLTVDLNRVTRFKQASLRFAPYSFTTLKSKLLKEFGSSFEVATTRHYVVCAPRGQAKTYCDVFEKTWRRFHMYFAIRGFELNDPEFPMVAVILKDRKSFLDYARKEQAQVDTNILGYYWSIHNRVIMFEDQKSHAATSGQRPQTEERLLATALHHSGSGGDSYLRTRLGDDAWRWAFDKSPTDDLFRTREYSNTVMARASIRSDLRETMIHEATHQLGYNLGLHNRTGRNPKWIVEGLATVFETPGMEKYAMDRDVKKRVNPGWHFGFTRFVKGGRPKAFLEAFIRDDRFFETQMGDAYSQAWALSFWLIETRPRKYAEFLQRMASAEVTRQLTPEMRVKLFKDSFGENLLMLDAEMLRFYSRIK